MISFSIIYKFELVVREWFSVEKEKLRRTEKVPQVSVTLRVAPCDLRQAKFKLSTATEHVMRYNELLHQTGREKGVIIAA